MMTTRNNPGGTPDKEKKPPERTGSFKPPTQPAGPYSRDPQSGENPEADDITYGDEAQKRRQHMSEVQKAEGDR